MGISGLYLKKKHELYRQTITVQKDVIEQISLLKSYHHDQNYEQTGFLIASLQTTPNRSCHVIWSALFSLHARAADATALLTALQELHDGDIILGVSMISSILPQGRDVLSYIGIPPLNKWDTTAFITIKGDMSTTKMFRAGVNESATVASMITSNLILKTKNKSKLLL